MNCPLSDLANSSHSALFSKARLLSHSDLQLCSFPNNSTHTKQQARTNTMHLENEAHTERKTRWDHEQGADKGDVGP